MVINVCDHEAKARADAERLAARLGKGWETRVWENAMGWHHEAQYKGLIHVYPSSRDGTWFCMIGECGMNAHLAPDDIPRLEDPVEVVRLTVAGYKKNWEKKKAIEEALIAAGEESLRRPDVSRTNSDRWLREGMTSMTFESWVAWRNAGNGED